MHIRLYNNNYLLKLNTNLILFEVLEEKKSEFCIIDGFLQIKKEENDIVFKSIKDNTIYLLQQPKPLA